MKKLISVIMPVYNSFEFLEEAIYSILNQTYGDFEFLILNDGSTDEKVSILLRRLKKEDNRIQLFETENNGVTRSLNLLLGVAEGKYIFRQDSDDVSDGCRIETSLEEFKKDDELGAICSISNVIDENSNIIGKTNYYKDLSMCLEKENPVVHGSVAYRRDVIEDIGGYDDKFPFCQSYELWRRIDKFSKIIMVNKELYSFRKHPNSFTKINDDSNLAIRKSIKDIEKENIKKIDNYEYYRKYSKDLIRSRHKSN